MNDQNKASLFLVLGVVFGLLIAIIRPKLYLTILLIVLAALSVFMAVYYYHSLKSKDSQRTKK